MKKLTKKTLMAIFALVLAVVALGTTTYAWFTVGQSVAVDSFNMQVKSEEGIEIRYEGKSINSNWSQYLDNATFLERFGADYSPTTLSDFRFDAVTSKDGQTFKKLVMGSGDPTLADIAADAVKADGSNIIEFDLGFRTKKQNASLKWSGVTLSSTKSEWSPAKTYTHMTYDEILANSVKKDYYAHHAARVSVSKLVSGVESDTIVYEADNTTGVNTNNTVLGNGSVLSGNWDKGAHGYFTAMTGKSLATAWAATDTTPKTATTVTSLAASPFVVTFGTVADGDGYYTVSVTVRVYLEGFDHDAINGILGGTISLALEFSLA
mgnify:FL=1